MLVFLLVFLCIWVSSLMTGHWMDECVAHGQQPLWGLFLRFFFFFFFFFFFLLLLSLSPRRLAHMVEWKGRRGEARQGCKVALRDIRKGRRCVPDQTQAVLAYCRDSRRQVVVSVMVPSPRWPMAVGCVNSTDEASYRAAWGWRAARNGEGGEPTIHRSGERTQVIPSSEGVLQAKVWPPSPSKQWNQWIPDEHGKGEGRPCGDNT